MIIIIDGYNVLKAVYKGADVSKKERAAFISALGKYASRLKHKIVLVFDGGPYEWVHKERISGVQVVFSGFNETADDYIRHYLSKHKTRDLLLVSSDHELILHASRIKIPSIGGYDFYELMQEELRRGPKQHTARGGIAQKISQEDYPELDALMEQASNAVPIKSEDITVQRKTRLSPTKKASKIDRILIKKLKKL